MSDKLIVRHCSPTLAGMKTGNMFTCHFDNADDMKKDLRNLNDLLVKKVCVFYLFILKIIKL